MGPAIDPCAGEGALLDAVGERFGANCPILAADIDEQNTKFLRNTNPTWTVGTADALSARSRRSSRPWKSARSDGIAIAVLNPPFSYRGGGGASLQYGQFAGRVSPAAAVLGAILTECPPWFGVWALMPTGILTNQRHRKFWSEVSTHWNVNLLENIDSGAFATARAQVSLLAVTPRIRARRNPAQAPRILSRQVVLRQADQTCVCVDVVRGRVERHRKLDRTVESHPYLHTTDLTQAGIRGPLPPAPATLATQGNYIILRRIGRPTTPLLYVNNGCAYVLSDCLFALRPLAASQIRTLSQTLSANVPALSELYGGTGASHITQKDLQALLVTLGFNARLVKASDAPRPCTCAGSKRSVA